MKKYFQIILIAIIAVSSCNSKPEKSKNSEVVRLLETIPTESINLNFLADIDSSMFHLATSKQDTIQIIVFDANCSICIARLIEGINDMKPKENFMYFFISPTENMDIFEYYVEKHCRTIEKNEIFLSDKGNAFELFNPLFYKEAIPRITIGPNSNIIDIEYLNI